MDDEADVVDLVRRAGRGDRAAWDALVDRYAPLVWEICRRRRLCAADAEEVFQSVWLRLVERLRDLREPAALPGWLIATTGRECLEDPPVSYARISARLGMPIGEIGPGRARCPDRLRGCAVLAAHFGPVRNYGEGSEA
jgi:hypothetical protein